MACHAFACHFFCALVACIATLISCADAENFVSSQFGFRFETPAGFRKLDDTRDSVVVAFASEKNGSPTYPSIAFIHLKAQYNPADTVALDQLPRVEGKRNSLETRSWKKLQLQVVRTESGDPPQNLIEYRIIFPLKGEAVMLLVDGLLSEDKKVRQLFDDSVESFEAFEPYAEAQTNSTNGLNSPVLSRFLIPLVGLLMSGAVTFFLLRRVQASQRKLISDPNNPLLNSALPTNVVVGSVRAQPAGVVIMAVLNLVIGLFFIWSAVSPIAYVFSTATGPVRFTTPYAFHFLAQLLAAAIALSSAVGLFFGASWGWWLAAIHWAWCLCRQVILPIALGSAVSSRPVSTDLWITGLVVYGLALIYLFRENVLQYFNLAHMKKLLAVAVVVTIAMLLSYCLRI